MVQGINLSKYNNQKCGGGEWPWDKTKIIKYNETDSAHTWLRPWISGNCVCVCLLLNWLYIYKCKTYLIEN